MAGIIQELEHMMKDFLKKMGAMLNSLATLVKIT
jgi:hypothetical protein